MAIIDGVVFILLFFSFEETLFPRFLFSASSVGIQDTAVADLESDHKPQQVTTVNVANSYDFPRRNYLERLRLWVFYPEDRTTYWQYFRRPFFLLSFPNVIIVSPSKADATELALTSSRPALSSLSAVRQA